MYGVNAVDKARVHFHQSQQVLFKKKKTCRCLITFLLKYKSTKCCNVCTADTFDQNNHINVATTVKCCNNS